MDQEIMKPGFAPEIIDHQENEQIADNIEPLKKAVMKVSGKKSGNK
jgi:hypothetical protein